MTAPGFTRTFLYMLGGLIVWAIRFLAVYIFTALACARGWAEAELAGFGIVPAAIVLAAIAGIGACLALIVHACRRMRLRPEGDDNARFVHGLAALIAGIATVAMIWETVPAFFVTACPT